MSLTGVPPVQMPKNMGKMPMRLMGETPMLRRMAFFNGLLNHENAMLVAEVAEEAERREEKRNEFSFCILTFIPVLCFSQLPQRLTRLHFQSRDAEIRREKFRRRRNDIHSIDNTQTPGDERRNLSRKNEIHVSSSADSESLCRDPLGFSQCQKLWAHPTLPNSCRFSCNPSDLNLLCLRERSIR